MSRKDELVKNDESSGAIGGPDTQMSNKAGLKSSSRKPSNTGPDPHEEHAAPVAGAFGKEENREADQRGQFAPVDNAIKKRRG